MLVICMLLSLVFPSSWRVSNAASASDKVTVLMSHSMGLIRPE